MAVFVNNDQQDLVFSVKLQLKKNLCARQFGKAQVQKLCFIPPKIIFIEVHFGSEKILGLKKIFAKKIKIPKKNVGPKKSWVQIKFLVRNFFGLVAGWLPGGRGFGGS